MVGQLNRPGPGSFKPKPLTGRRSEVEGFIRDNPTHPLRVAGHHGE